MVFWVRGSRHGKYACAIFFSSFFYVDHMQLVRVVEVVMGEMFFFALYSMGYLLVIDICGGWFVHSTVG